MPNTAKYSTAIHNAIKVEADKKRRKKNKKRSELVELMAPRESNPNWMGFVNQKNATSRCCYVSMPEQEDFCEQFQFLLNKRDIDTLVSAERLINLTKASKTSLENEICEVENGSQYITTLDEEAANIVEPETENVEMFYKNTESINYITYNEPPKLKEIPKTVHISDVPRLKIIAEKFTKFNKNDIEVRKLEERIVCLEYDVFEKTDVEGTDEEPIGNGEGPVGKDDESVEKDEEPIRKDEKPIMKMRAFFSVKPRNFEKDGQSLKIPSNIRSHFTMAEADLQKLSNKEIEIIDENISENKSYLEDLKRILKRRQVIEIKKQQTKLDLLSLYEMARKEHAVLEEILDTDFLSKAELEEIKDMILNKPICSMHGIRRKTINKTPKENDFNSDHNVISYSLLTEIIKDKS